jgi:uncharacterized membrane protein
VASRHPDTLSLRYLAAPAAVATVGAGLVAAAVGVVARQPWLVTLGLAAPVGYAVADLAATAQSALVAPRLPVGAAIRLPLVYATMHGAWGTGFLRGGAESRR